MYLLPCFLLFLSLLDLRNINGHKDEDSPYKSTEVIPTHSLWAPFLESYWQGGLGHWDFGAATVLTNTVVHLNGGWIRNLDRVDMDHWRFVARVGYRGEPKNPLVFTYSTLNGNHPFFWIELWPDLVKVSGLNVTPAEGPYRPFMFTSGELELTVSYTSKKEKLTIRTGEEEEACLETEAFLTHGYHLGIQGTPEGEKEQEWFLISFTFTNLPEQSTPESVNVHNIDQLQKFIREHDLRERKRFSHPEAERRTQAEHSQRQRQYDEERKKRERERDREKKTSIYERTSKRETVEPQMSTTRGKRNSEGKGRDRVSREERLSPFDDEKPVRHSDYRYEFDHGGRIDPSPPASQKKSDVEEEASLVQNQRDRHSVLNPHDVPPLDDPSSPTKKEAEVPKTREINQTDSPHVSSGLSPPPLPKIPPASSFFPGFPPPASFRSIPTPWIASSHL